MKNYSFLVNETHLLPSDYHPQKLVQAPFTAEKILVEEVLAKQLEALIYFIDGQNEIIVTSGYRDYFEQEKLYQDSIGENGLEFTQQFVAKPKASEHQTGLAVDLGLTGVENDMIAPTFEKRLIVEKFLKEMVNFGFILRYPKEKTDKTKIAYEPWHFRYVGTPHSQIMQGKQWVLEEYHEFMSYWSGKYVQ
ncbi:MAG: D-alanyl-D-alanine carboxypeptidase family protein [Lactobacillales bacterium]|jgi:D-alanyl-D-alanine dipeptidase/carboxypeptidase|nr:D-alanyl-D-alanine carboxypeptidase family protein [Lactobacillales bacterium]